MRPALMVVALVRGCAPQNGLHNQTGTVVVVVVALAAVWGGMHLCYCTPASHTTRCHISWLASARPLFAPALLSPRKGQAFNLRMNGYQNSCMQ